MKDENLNPGETANSDLGAVSNSAVSKKQCPQGHGKMKKSYSGTWFCINCQRYYE